jgi:hypothetical protein
LTTLAIKITIVFCLVFSQSIFADSGPVITNMQPFQNVSRDTNKIGMVKTETAIYHGENDFEIIVMIHNHKDSLVHSKHHVWKEGKLVQEINNGVSRTIISGDTSCSFAIVEPPSDTVYFHLDPKKEPNKFPETEIEQIFSNSNSEILPKYKYEAILYIRWNSGCRYRSGF